MFCRYSLFGCQTRSVRNASSRARMRAMRWISDLHVTQIEFSASTYATSLGYGYAYACTLYLLLLRLQNASASHAHTSCSDLSFGFADMRAVADNVGFYADTVTSRLRQRTKIRQFCACLRRRRIVRPFTSDFGWIG